MSTSGKADNGETIQMIRRSKIRVDESIQSRPDIDHATVDRYVECHKAGDTFPELRVVQDVDDGGYWLWDGFHRLEMYSLLKTANVSCKVRMGTKEDAIELSAGANYDHGLPRTIDGKERSVMMLLGLEKYRKASSQQLAKLARVSWSFAEKIRNREIGKPTERVSSNGKAFTVPDKPPAREPDAEPVDADKIIDLGDSTDPTPMPVAIVEDAYDRPVPARLNDVFGQRREIARLAKLLAEATTQLEAAIRHGSKAGQMISWPAVQTNLNNAKQTLRSGMPAALCPKCDGVESPADEPCDTCDGKGWVHEGRIAQLPNAMRKKIQSSLRGA